MKIFCKVENKLNFITLDNNRLKITLCDLGASIFSIFFDNKLMTMTSENIENFKLINVYNGKTIGRTSNRIKGNRISIDGKEFVIKNNEGNNILHGGQDGISGKIFDFKIIKKINFTKVIFSYLSKDGESGFPGDLEVKVIYNFYENSDKFTIKFEGKTSKPTLCNLTNHTFFTLGEKSINSLHLKLNASKYVKCDINDLIPLHIEKINKKLDFKKSKPFVPDIEKLRFGKQNGYDHCFVCDNNTVITLKSNNYILKINSNFDCCQIYTDNWPNDSIHWIDLPNGSNRSVAIEPQDNILKCNVLRPGEKYSRFIKYQFKRAK